LSLRARHTHAHWADKLTLCANGKQIPRGHNGRSVFMKIVVVVRTKPIAASRPRIPRFGKPYFAKTYKTWRDTAHDIVPEYTETPIDYPVKVNVLFAIPRARTSKLLVPMGDGDNFEKALFDLIQRKKYLSDDKWITTGTWRKRFLPFGAEGYSYIAIEPEDEEIDIEPAY